MFFPLLSITLLALGEARPPSFQTARTLSGVQSLTSRRLLDDTIGAESLFYEVSATNRAFEDITSTGNRSRTSDVDDLPEESVDMPTPYPFYGHLYTSVFINPNGFMAPERNACPQQAFCNWNLPAGAQTLYPQYIAPMMTDLSPMAQARSGVFYQLTEFNDTTWRFVVQWNLVALYRNQPRPDDLVFTFQAELHSNGVIRLNYKHVPLDVSKFTLDSNGQNYPLIVGISEKDRNGGRLGPLAFSVVDALVPDFSWTLVPLPTCPAEPFAGGGNSSWPRTPAGHLAELRCAPPLLGSFRRNCSEEGWAEAEDLCFSTSSDASYATISSLIATAIAAVSIIWCLLVKHRQSRKEIEYRRQEDQEAELLSMQAQAAADAENSESSSDDHEGQERPPSPSPALAGSHPRVPSTQPAQANVLAGPTVHDTSSSPASSSSASSSSSSSSVSSSSSTSSGSSASVSNSGAAGIELELLPTLARVDEARATVDVVVDPSPGHS